MLTTPRSVTCVLGLTLALSMTSPAHAWNNKGHMMIAFVAYERLRPVVKDRVDHLLALNPLHDTWVSMMPEGTTEAETKRRVFMLAATWPDLIKTDPAHIEDGTENGNRPTSDPSSSQNIGYADMSRHRYWHFVYTPFSDDGTPLPPVRTPNALDRIALFRAVLSSMSATDALKSYDLVWLVHLIGDVHQPLHAATRVSAAQPDGDDGGSLVKLCNLDCRDELRGFWNNILGTEQAVTAAEHLAESLPAAPAAQAGVLDETQWVEESLALARSRVYQAPIGAGAGPFTITRAYRTAAKALAKKQIALAGARLANVLNRELE